jgi:hypothetical protein
MILGLVFSEEISLSWTNVAMFVRGMPSISALSVTSNVQSDWLRKGIVLVLALASATMGNAQVILTLSGISMAAAVLLANLGSRSWRFLQWRPIAYAGPFQSAVAFLAAMATGALFPYLSHRQVEAGGKAAMESVIRIAFMVAVIFVISDYDEIQKFLVIGSEACNQDFVNLAVGAWWAISLVASLFLVLRIEPQGIWPDDEEPLLEEDHASPVGFKVPNLPDFPIDPILANPGLPVIDIRAEFCFGVLMALAVGGGICFLGFTTEDEEIASNLKNSFV